MTLAELRAKLASAVQEADNLMATVANENRDLNETEISTLTARADEIKALRAREVQLVEIEEARNALKAAEASIPTIQVKSEPETYRKDIREYSFMGDVARAFTGDSLAAERLNRHMAEQRAINTTVGTGGAYVPPAYLEKDAIAFRRFARVTADLVGTAPLPEGTMSVNIPKMATGTAVGTQSSQNTAISETDFTDSFVTQPVITLAGQQTVSIQFIERSPIPVEDMVFGDLNNALDQSIDNYVISALSGAGTAVSYTSASPTAAGLLPILGQGKASVATGSAKTPANAIVMTPSRWEWLVATGVDSTGRPLVVPNGQVFNSFGSYDIDLTQGPIAAGSVLGLPVFVDGNIPSNLGTGTNQDEIFIMASKQHILMEGTTMVRALPQTLGGNLSVLLQVYKYITFFPNRYADATAVVGGTGLVTPVF